MFVSNTFNEPEVIFLHTVKLFQVLLYNTNSIKHQAFVCTHLNGFKYRE